MLKIKKDFPALEQKVYGQDFIYLDSAATTLKPQPVIDTIAQFNKLETFNVHRGSHFLGQKITEKFETAREKIQNFIGAQSSEEIIFTKGTTEGLNLIAQCLSYEHIHEGDTILLTQMEHHANIVPWQMISLRKKIQLKYVDVLEDGSLDQTDFEAKLIKYKPKVVSLTACSNVLGTINPISELVALAKKQNAICVVDGAQIVSQYQIDVKKINCDFFVFSAHKLFGPTGFGVLYGKKDLLNVLPPYQGGGSMIAEVLPEYSTWNILPFKFEAGTPHIEGALGTATAIDYIQQIGFDAIQAHKNNLVKIINEQSNLLGGLLVYGKTALKAPIFSFNLVGAHHSDVSQLLDQQAIAVRAGHHCAQMLMKRFSTTGSVRASFSIYNDEIDVEKFFSALKKAKDMLV